MTETTKEVTDPLEGLTADILDRWAKIGHAEQITLAKDDVDRLFYSLAHAHVTQAVLRTAILEVAKQTEVSVAPSTLKDFNSLNDSGYNLAVSFLRSVILRNTEGKSE